jgi:hypothetical protein
MQERSTPTNGEAGPPRTSKSLFALQHLFGELTPLVNTPGLAELLHNLSKRQS